MDFNCSHFDDIFKKKLHIVTRVNNEIVAYHQLIDANYCVLKEILINNKDNLNSLLMNFVCVNPKYRSGNLFYFLNYIVAHKFAIENKYNFICQLVDSDSPAQVSIQNFGFKQYTDQYFTIQDCWDSYYSTVQTKFYVSQVFNQSNKYELLQLINNLLNLTLSNDKINFFNKLKYLNTNNNKSKL